MPIDTRQRLPLAQYPRYHDFADDRSPWPIPEKLNSSARLIFVRAGIGGPLRLRLRLPS